MNTLLKSFNGRLKDLKSELEKRLDIWYKNESDNESEDESDNESEDSIFHQRWTTFHRQLENISYHENSPLINLSEAELDEKFKNSQIPLEATNR